MPEFMAPPPPHPDDKRPPPPPPHPEDKRPGDDDA